MSLQTTEAQAAARAAEADWSAHRKTCSQCGSRQRSVRKCKTGTQLAADALELRNEAKNQAKLDATPDESQPRLF